MRESTLNELQVAVTSLRDHFQKDTISRQELITFKENRPDVYFPASFVQICQCKTRRATFDLSLFNTFVEKEFSNVKTVISQSVEHTIHQETDDQIRNRIDTRFAVMDMMAHSAVNGNCRSLIIAGAAGLGKSFTVESAVKELPAENYQILKGQVTPAGLFKTLWKHRHQGHVIVLDDSDDVLENERSLNYLKSACDSSDERFITRAAATCAFDPEGEEIPSTFQFEGSIIFITNKDFKAEVAKGNKLSCHLSAMLSRSHYIDIGITTEREYLIRIESVVYGTNMLSAYDDRTRDEVVQFINMNSKKMMELSLRMVKKIADLTRISPENWRDIASVTCMN